MHVTVVVADFIISVVSIVAVTLKRYCCCVVIVVVQDPYVGVYFGPPAESAARPRAQLSNCRR